MSTLIQLLPVCYCSKGILGLSCMVFNFPLACFSRINQDIMIQQIHAICSQRVSRGFIHCLTDVEHLQAFGGSVQTVSFALQESFLWRQQQSLAPRCMYSKVHEYSKWSYIFEYLYLGDTHAQQLNEPSHQWTITPSVLIGWIAPIMIAACSHTYVWQIIHLTPPPAPFLPICLPQ